MESKLMQGVVTSESQALDGRVRPRSIVTDVFTVMSAETEGKQFFCVEHVELDKATGKVTLHRVPLAEWPDWAIELRKQVHGI